jgi:hydroxyacylglutathione hydrolase
MRNLLGEMRYYLTHEGRILADEPSKRGHEMKITEHVHALKIPFEVRGPSGQSIPRFVYAYFLMGERICAIDSGVAGKEQTIFEYLKEMGLRPEEISLLILTHSHPDHIGAARAMQMASGCEIAAHAAERAWIEDVELQFRERPVPGFHSLVGGSVRVSRILQDGDVLDLGGGLSIKVLHTPGHSLGSISLWLSGEGLLFSADAVPIPGEMPIFDDATASIASIERLKAIEGIRALLSAWDEPRRDEQAYRAMDEGIGYLQRIRGAALKVASADPRLWADPMKLCMQVLKELGLPENMANPLVARSFQACLNQIDQG